MELLYKLIEFLKQNRHDLSQCVKNPETDQEMISLLSGFLQEIDYIEEKWAAIDDLAEEIKNISYYKGTFDAEKIVKMTNNEINDEMKKLQSELPSSL
jgi:hypothetical protein